MQYSPVVAKIDLVGSVRGGTAGPQVEPEAARDETDEFSSGSGRSRESGNRREPGFQSRLTLRSSPAGVKHRPDALADANLND